jgi:hypothetical protein
MKNTIYKPAFPPLPSAENRQKKLHISAEPAERRKNAIFSSA